VEFNLRHAEETDFENISNSVFKAFTESPYKDQYTFNQQRVVSVLKHMHSLGKQGAILLIAEDKEKNIVGLFLAMLSFTSAGLEPMASEILWWVSPDYRKTRLSITFIEAFEFWASKLGVTKLVLGSMENNHVNAIDKFYRKRGYTLTERTYFKELKNNGIRN